MHDDMLCWMMMKRRRKRDERLDDMSDDQKRKPNVKQRTLVYGKMQG